MLSPLCGLDQRIGFLSRSSHEPRIITAGADLTGVHVLRNQQPPRQGFYHIGGGGIFLDEALIRSLGETIERYSQFVSEISGRHTIVMASYNEMVRRGEPILTRESLQFCTTQQYARPGFPYQAFSPDTPMGWVKVPSLVHDGELWALAQLVLVGYQPKHHEGEHWLLSSVTTGSAAHTDRYRALRNALLELVQIDSAMGHWYSASRAPQIRSSRRTRAIEQLIERHFSRRQPRPQFYWFQNPDLPGLTVACVIRQEPHATPAVGVGLGSDLSLQAAMYKALLEAVGVLQLAKLQLLNLNIEPGEETVINTEQIFDLDSNVAYYAQVGHQDFINEKFVDAETINADDLPADLTTDIADELRLLVRGFGDSGKELVFMDLTTADVRELGFTALRVWSPDTLSLSLPSAPPLRHVRFRAYGGVAHEQPHPYP
jgi:thiazole/oxazole-forming peptide maturase SagD family component